MPTISEMFDYYPGNHGLTDEVVYNNQPTSPEDSVPIFSGSEDNIVPVGYIRKGAHNKEGKDIVYFEGPCLILTKDGSAGLLTFRDKDEGLFTINHHACILKPKNEWATKVDPEWFAAQYERRFCQYVTSKADNRVFSTKWFDRIQFELLDYDTQVKQRDKKRSLESVAQALSRLSKSLDQLSRSTNMEFHTASTEQIENIFVFRGGNSGLTEEFVYHKQPTNEQEKVPILSGATLEANLMGHVSRHATPNGKKLRVFEGPCVLVTRNGWYAGTMTYIASGQFTTNDHAYVMTPKKIWKDQVNLRWFAYQYQELFYNLVTSKSDNATFNKDNAERQKVQISHISMQNALADKLLRIDSLFKNIGRLRTIIEESKEYEIA